MDGRFSIHPDMMISAAMVTQIEPWIIFAAYITGISVVTFIMYGLDKLQAKRNKWRISEAMLHGCALIGGTPGAIAGQIVFRHKTVKSSFRLVFFAIVVLQVIAIGAYFWLNR